MKKLEELFNPLELREEVLRKTETCSQCKKTKISPSQVRCETCKQSTCIACKKNLTKYHKVIFSENATHGQNKVFGEIIYLCRNKDCWKAIENVKGWEEVEISV